MSGREDRDQKESNLDRDGSPDLVESGADERPESFDPTPYLHALRGRRGTEEYLDVKHRLLWLRREHPDARIETEHILIDSQSAVFRAKVQLPGGGSATGHGSETATDFADYIEKAETKALGRALNALGYGAQFAEGESEPRVATSPRDRPANVKSSLQIREREPAPDESPLAPTPLVPRSNEDRDGQPEPASSSATSSAEPALEDYSWTSFWRWARPLGFDERQDIEEAIGQTIGGMNPMQVRKLMLEAGLGAP
jgi:hypothetical protein